MANDLNGKIRKGGYVTIPVVAFIAAFSLIYRHDENIKNNKEDIIEFKMEQRQAVKDINSAVDKIADAVIAQKVATVKQMGVINVEVGKIGENIKYIQEDIRDLKAAQ